MIILTLLAIVAIGAKACRLMDYIAMFEATIDLTELNNQIFVYPNASSTKKTVFSLCRDLDRATKLRCGFGSETNLTLAVFEEDYCVAYRTLADFVTARVYKDGDMLNLDIVYSKDDTGHFYIINFKKSDDHNKKPVEQSEHQFGLWFKTPLVATEYTIKVKETPVTVQKKNFMSHTYLNSMDSLFSWFLHLVFAYTMIYHTKSTKSRWISFRPCGCYMSAYIGLRVVAWVDGTMFYFRGVENDRMILILYAILPVVSLYYYEVYREGKRLIPVVLALYIAVGIFDYLVLLVFLSIGLAIVGIVYFVFLACLPILTSDLIEDPSEWLISMGFVLELFVQQVLWFPFKKVGAVKLYLAGLDSYYIDTSFTLFGVATVVLLLPAAILKYKFARYRSTENLRYHSRKIMTGTFIYDSPRDKLVESLDQSR